MNSIFEVPYSVLLNKELSSSSKLTLCVLYSLAIDDSIKISHEKIGEILNLSRLTVRDALLQLTELGFITTSRDDRGWFTYKVGVRCQE